MKVLAGKGRRLPHTYYSQRRFCFTTSKCSGVEHQQSCLQGKKDFLEDRQNELNDAFEHVLTELKNMGVSRILQQFTLAILSALLAVPSLRSFQKSAGVVSTTFLSAPFVQ